MAIIFSEWVASNISTVVTLVVVIIGFIVWLIRLEQQLKHMTEQLTKIGSKQEAQQSDFAAHKADGDAHVNHLYMRELDNRLNKVEATVTSGFEKVNEKIDDRFDRMMDKFNETRR